METLEMKAKAIEEIKRTINQSKSAINEQTRENYYQIAQAKIHIVYKIGLLTTDDIEALYDELNA